MGSLTCPVAGPVTGSVAGTVSTLLLLLIPWPSAGGESPQSQPGDKSPGVWQDLGWTDLDGHTWTADDLLGRIVIVDFWATWCAPCLAELPNLRRLHATHRDDGLVVLGVALDAIDRRRLHSFLRRHGVDWPQVHEPQGVAGKAARRFGVDVVPAVFVVDTKGRVVARDLRGSALRATIEACLEIRHGVADTAD